MSGPPPPTWVVDEASARADRIVPGLWRLRLPLTWPHVTHANAYLIEGAGEGPLLVDCGGGGHPSAWRALCRALGEAGCRAADIRDLVFTHAHSDHMGLGATLAREGPKAVWMHPSIAHMTDLVTDTERISAWRVSLALREGATAAIAGSFGDLREYTEGMEWPMRVDRRLVPGVKVPSALGDWEVVPASGHAPSQVALVQREHEIMLGGDLVSAGFFPAFDYGYSPDPVEEWIRALESVPELPVSMILPGHGGPITEVREITDLYLSGMRSGVEGLLDALGEDSATCFELCEASFDQPEWVYLDVTRFTTTLTYLSHLVQNGRLERQQVDGVHRYAVAQGIPLHRD